MTFIEYPKWLAFLDGTVMKPHLRLNTKGLLWRRAREWRGIVREWRGVPGPWRIYGHIYKGRVSIIWRHEVD